MSPFTPICLLIRPARLVLYCEQGTVFRHIERGWCRCASTSAIAEDIQGDLIEPLLHPQRAYACNRIVFERMMGTLKCLLNDIFGILRIPCLAQSKGIESMLVHRHQLPKVTIEIGCQ
jgi:hypothetical protein